tara:strand:- start:187 stop:756 length:570 start_codon:yes stop_codon:yes gene_type:complete
MALSKIDIENMVTGELTTTNGGTGATSFTAGITMAQQWRVSAAYTGDNSPITSNWEISDDPSHTSIGSNMTESSGIFTFPSTGIYHVEFDALAYHDAETGHNVIQIEFTQNNSSYQTVAMGSAHIEASGTDPAGNGAVYVACRALLDVTNVSTHKVRFDAYTSSSPNASWNFDTDIQSGGVTFMRIGDT